MKEHSKTILSACIRRITSDESGASLMRFLDRFVALGALTQDQADWYFETAERLVWQKPIAWRWPRKEKAVAS